MILWNRIEADPPWPESGGGGRGAQNHYQLIRKPVDIFHTMRHARFADGSPAWRPDDPVGLRGTDRPRARERQADPLTQAARDRGSNRRCIPHGPRAGDVLAHRAKGSALVGKRDRLSASRANQPTSRARKGYWVTVFLLSIISDWAWGDIHTQMIRAGHGDIVCQ